MFLFLGFMVMAGSTLQAQVKPLPERIMLSKPVPAKPQSNVAALKSDLATKEYGFFCRQELKLDKQTPVPVRFRLGSMQQCDWLERKPNAQPPKP